MTHKCVRTNEGGKEGAEHFRQCHAQISPAHTHLWLSPPGFVRGRLLDEGSGGNGDGEGQERVEYREVKGTGGGGE